MCSVYNISRFYCKTFVWWNVDLFTACREDAKKLIFQELVGR